MQFRHVRYVTTAALIGLLLVAVLQMGAGDIGALYGLQANDFNWPVLAIQALIVAAIVIVIVADRVEPPNK